MSFSYRPQVITDKRCFHVVDREVPSGNKICCDILMECLYDFFLSYYKHSVFILIGRQSVSSNFYAISTNHQLLFYRKHSFKWSVLKRRLKRSLYEYLKWTFNMECMCSTTRTLIVSLLCLHSMIKRCHSVNRKVTGWQSFIMYM